ncbi:MAG: carboxypeptidase-like regulatory domain-containing protein [Fulvivirga sp.]|nr:carboxypeptidase-like regulatory domain-containing protein [Fulvivirga sp.]
MRLLLSIVTLNLMLVGTVAGQQHKIEISGRIIDKITEEAVPFVHVYNLSTTEGTASNAEGEFTIMMSKTDTLQFSAIGFETFAFTLKPGISNQKLEVTIALNATTLELEPVKVFAFRDEDALKRAILDLEIPNELDKSKKLVIPGVKEAVEESAPSTSSGLSLGGPLTAIANIFSKERKEKKKLGQLEKDYEYQKLLTSKYNKEIVMKITNLPADKIEDFMEFCVLEDSFIFRATEYELAVVLHDCLADFNKLPE